MREKAIKMYVDGINFRRIGRFLNVHHQSMINWVNAYVEKLPDAPTPEQIEDVEMDELYTFIGSKKQDLRNSLCRSSNQMYSWLES